MTGISVSFPSGSDYKIINLYLMVNFLLTVFTIVEFTIVSYYGTEKQKLKRESKGQNHSSVTSYDTPETEKDGCLVSLLKKWFRFGSGDIDVTCRFLVIPMFLIWNVIYFAIAFTLSFLQ